MVERYGRGGEEREREGVREGEENGVREGGRTWRSEEEETGDIRHEMRCHSISMSLVRGSPRRRLCTGST